MQLRVTMRLTAPAAARHMRVARPVRAFSASSAYLGRRIERSSVLGLPQLPSRRCRRAAAAQPVRASFFGVGAPEAILVGVVALVVFGPKGLAQAAKSIGSTLRSFAPTLREITSVSQELKSTLEQEIGINEIKEELSRPAVPTPKPAPASTSGEAGAAASTAPQQGAALGELADSMAAQGQRIDDSMASVIDPEIERKRAEAAAAAWGGAAPAAAAAAAAAPPAPAAAAPAAAAPAAGPAAGGKPKGVDTMSLEELEAELARRKAAVAAGQLPKQLSASDDA